jgi:hypothetical protein
MATPQMPTMPGVGAVADTLEFVKNLWGSMSVPGMGMPGLIAPSMSVDDLDKKIADLKAVEAWLNVNVSMLRGTIQAMEVQRGTIATLQSMGAALSNAVKQPGADEQSVRAAAPFVSAFFTQPAAAPAPARAAPPAPAPAAAKADSAAAAKPALGDAAGLANPAAWWTMLQDQFKQAVSTAMSPDAMAAAGAKAFDAAAKMGAQVSAPAAPAAAKPATPAKKSAPAKKAASAAKAVVKPAARKRTQAKPKG